MPRSLTWRVILLMTLAMLPLGLIATYQTNAVVREVRVKADAALLAETLATAARMRAAIHESFGAGYALGTSVSTLPVARCQAALGAFVSGHAGFEFAGFIAPDGQMRCHSMADPVDMPDEPAFQRAVESERPVVHALPHGRVTQNPVVETVQPVFHDGTLQGAVTLSVPLWVASGALHSETAQNDLHLVALTIDGDVIAASPDAADLGSILPADVAPEKLASYGRQVFHAETINGVERSFAITHLIDDTVVLIGSAPGSVGPSPMQTSAAAAIAFPVLMWVAGVCVAYFGLQRLVVRHIANLRSAMRKFALGERHTVALDLDGTPEEIAEAQRAFNRMAVLITEAETRKEQDLQEKTVLLREVHHRVKNNLQIIASIMNIQARRVETPEARHILAGLQRRVRGLAMLHRTLYATTELTTVNAASLVRTVIRDVAELSSQDSDAIVTDLDDLLLYPDAAVPVSMILAEALSNAIKYGHSGPDGQRDIRVSLKRLETNTLVLTVSNLLPDETDEDGALAENGEDLRRDGLGSWLIAAFVRQLDGAFEQKRESARHVTRITFPLDADLTIG